MLLILCWVDPNYRQDISEAAEWLYQAKSIIKGRLEKSQRCSKTCLPFLTQLASTETQQRRLSVCAAKGQHAEWTALEPRNQDLLCTIPKDLATPAVPEPAFCLVSYRSNSKKLPHIHTHNILSHKPRKQNPLCKYYFSLTNYSANSKPVIRKNSSWSLKVLLEELRTLITDKSQYHVVVFSSIRQQQWQKAFFKAKIYSFGKQLLSLILTKWIARTKRAAPSVAFFTWSPDLELGSWVFFLSLKNLPSAIHHTIWNSSLHKLSINCTLSSIIIQFCPFSRIFLQFGFKGKKAKQLDLHLIPQHINQIDTSFQASSFGADTVNIKN